MTRLETLIQWFTNKGFTISDIGGGVTSAFNPKNPFENYEVSIYGFRQKVNGVFQLRHWKLQDDQLITWL